MIRKIFFAICILTLQSQISNSQGCSDAGFCTVGTLSPMNPLDSSFQHSARLTFSYGAGEQSTAHIHIIPELKLGLIRNNEVQIKIPYIYVDGDLGTNSGVGDLSLSTSQVLHSAERSSFSATVGFKIPTGSTNKSLNNLSLAMPYQTGLGTFDLILGASYWYRNWRLSVGYQTILDDSNINSYLNSNGRTESERSYFNSNMLKRGDDALLRVERNFEWKNLNLSIGLLSIYRLQKDEIINATGLSESLKGSDGLTLNLTAGIDYELSDKSALGLLFGSPLIVRDVRSDGLTRAYVVSFSYQYRFAKQKN